MTQPNKRDELLNEILVRLRNADEWQQPGDEPIREARQQLNTLIDAAVVEARIDELKKLWNIADVGRATPDGSEPYVEVVSMLKIARRKAELQATQAKEKEL